MTISREAFCVRDCDPLGNAQIHRVGPLRIPPRLDTCVSVESLIDAKFYTNGNLPTSSSISKQMVYAEFAEQKGFASGEAIYNAFLWPYCHDDDDHEIRHAELLPKRNRAIRTVEYCKTSGHHSIN